MSEFEGKEPIIDSLLPGSVAPEVFEMIRKNIGLVACDIEQMPEVKRILSLAGFEYLTISSSTVRGGMNGRSGEMHRHRDGNTRCH